MLMALILVILRMVKVHPIVGGADINDYIGGVGTPWCWCC